jgi:hypothetical protein
MAESPPPVPSCQNQSLAARTMSFYWVLGTCYFYLFFVHLPSMTEVQLLPSDDISNLNV